SCKASCEFDTSGCINGTTGGGGGGGGGYVPPPIIPTLHGTGQVNFTGRAYPNSTVTLLKDAQIVATTIAGSDANFQISLTNITAGSYIFSVYSEDNKGNRSSLLTFPLSVTSGVVTNVTGIFISPTIDVDKVEVKKGEVIKIFGQAIPNSDITVIINSDKEIYGKTKADKI
ncbi:MAG: Ig-like domain-containing protein, partial [Minisyncoccia bacterium]